MELTKVPFIKLQNSKLHQKMRKQKSFYILVLALIAACSLPTIAKSQTINITKDRLDWFHEAKYGLFLHWGLYSIPAGEWKDSKPGTHAEWMQYSANIPNEEYEKLAPQFNPVKYDPKKWVTMAKKAGMKYIVITSKHCEGFSMFDSKLTKYDIVDATPYKKDPMKELAEECRKQDIKLCFYYAIKDWHHTDYPIEYTYYSKLQPEGFKGSPNPKADFMKYFDYMQGQVKELLTNYGPIGIMWFDWYGTAFDPNEVKNIARAKALVDSIHVWQPNCLINNRLGGFGADYGTPEQEIPGQTQNTAFEVCMTLNDNWGYIKSDKNWKSAKQTVYNLCDIASKGGNFLLGVGPTAEGEIPVKAQNILEEVGRWLLVNNEAISNTTAGRYAVRWNTDIKMVTEKPGKVYLHVFNYPADKKIYLEYFNHKVEKAYMLADKAQTPLKVDVHTRGIMVHLPKLPFDSINNVVVLKYAQN